jgi:hypothetical protein
VKTKKVKVEIILEMGDSADTQEVISEMDYNLDHIEIVSTEIRDFEEI